MTKAVIIDDEKAGIENLKALLARYCPQINVCGEASNVHTARQILMETKPGLVFLDIEMPLGSGFDLLASLEAIPFEVVFVTAFDKYAIQAIRIAAADYILKPINITDLITAVKRAEERIVSKADKTPVKTLLFNSQANNAERKIALPTLQGMLFIKIAEIVSFEAEGSYTWIYLSDQKKLLITKNVGEYEELLKDHGFFRVHHAALINCNHIVEFKKGNQPTLTMTNGAVINVSRRRKDMFLEIMRNQFL